MYSRVISHVDTRARTLFVCGLLSCALVLWACLFDVDRSHADAGSVSRPNEHTPSARTSKREPVDATLKFEITQIKGNVIQAQGKSLGTFAGSASLNLRLINASNAVAQIYAYNSHGAIRGLGASRYHASGAVSYFSGGRAPTVHGSGKYADLKVVTMNLSGYMNRRTLQISVHMKGVWDV